MKHEQSATQEPNLSIQMSVHHPTPTKEDRPENENRLTQGEFTQHDTSGNPCNFPIVSSCSSGDGLARNVVEMLKHMSGDALYLPSIDFSFSDSETCVRLSGDVSGRPIFLFQSLYNPISSRSVDQNYMAFLLAVRAFKEWGASSITGVLPYIAYARQNHPTKGEREPISARLMAELSTVAGVDRLITFRPHTDSIGDFYRDSTFEQLDSIAFFASVFAPFYNQTDAILVAPDAGAVPFVTAVGRALNLKCAVGSKFRPRAEECVLSEIIGDFNGIHTALVLDDMVSSGKTIYELIRCLHVEKGVQHIYLGVAHNLCQDQARERLLDLGANYGLKGVVFTNSIPQTKSFTMLPFVEVIDLSNLLAEHILNCFISRKN